MRVKVNWVCVCTCRMYSMVEWELTSLSLMLLHQSRRSSTRCTSACCMSTALAATINSWANSECITFLRTESHKLILSMILKDTALWLLTNTLLWRCRLSCMNSCPRVLLLCWSSMREKCFINLEKCFFVINKEVKQMTFIFVGKITYFYSVFSELS